MNIYDVDQHHHLSSTCLTCRLTLLDYKYTFCFRHRRKIKLSTKIRKHCEKKQTLHVIIKLKFSLS